MCINLDLGRQRNRSLGQGTMGIADVTQFRPYPFKEGQKIHIEDGPREGDWEVVGTTDRKVTLRCPRTNREYEWDRFCYFVETIQGDKWPEP